MKFLKFKSKLKLNLNPNLKSLFLTAIIISIGIIFGNIGTASAADYYVATNGSNSNSGTSISNAWATPSYAAQEAQAGDTIYLMDGTWYNEHVVFANSGTASNPIIMKAYNRRQAILDGQDCSSNGGIGIWPSKMLNGREYINIEGIVVKNYQYGIIVREGAHINITDCDVSLVNGQGAHFVDSTYCVLENSDIHDIGFNSVMIESHEGRGSHFISIKNNKIYDGPGDSGGSGHNGIDFSNYLVYSQSSAISDIEISGNEIYNINDNGIFVHSTGGELPMYNISIRNNIINNCVWGIQASRFDINSEVSNNVIYGNSRIGLYATTGGNATIKNNIIINNERGVSGGNIGELSYNNIWNNDLNYGGGASASPTDISKNPLFVNPANNDFHLQAGSPCIDAGNPSSQYSNEPSPNGSRINMGAYGNTSEAATSDGSAPPPPPPPEPQLENQLIAHYKFDETSGNRATDSSENNNNGALTNMDTSTAWVNGKINGGLEFDGIDDYVQVTDSTSLDNITDEITLMTWVKAGIGTRQTVFERWLYGTGVDERSFEFDISTDGTMNFALSSDGTNNTDQWLVSNGTITSNEWTHIAATSDGATMKIYINGQQDPNTAVSPANGIHQGKNLHIGAWEYNQGIRGSNFNGSIDELKIYNYALTSSEILSNYQNGNDPTPPTNHLPIGSLDSADQTSITGWAYDQNSNPIDVHIYIDGNLIGSSTANLNRPDLVSAGVAPDPNHGFIFSTPADLSAGDHTVNVYAINYPEGTNPELIGSPITFTISTPDPDPDPTPNPDPNPDPAPTPTPSPDPLPPPASYPESTLLKTPGSFKIYIIINQKKKWIPTPEVFETLGYEWTEITEIEKNQLDLIPDYEDNLIRMIDDFKVYLIVNGIKRHIPNPEIFLNYGFEWNEVKEVNQETINQYTQCNLIKESKKEEIYYLDPAKKIKRWLRSPEIFNSYPNNDWNNIQVISKYEMDSYPESNLIQLVGDNNVYLTEGNKKRLIKSVEEFEREGLDWGKVMEVGEGEWEWFGNL